MDEFEQMMAASTQPNLMDDPEVVSMLRGNEDAMTPEPVMHLRHMSALGITPPRSLLSSFTAAARSGMNCVVGECHTAWLCPHSEYRHMTGVYGTVVLLLLQLIHESMIL